jgi:diacylglycerol kinase family enzyme
VSGHIFVNPASGPDDTTVDDLRNRFAGHKVEECAGADLTQRVREVVREAPDFVGVAGGDGTISAAVQALMGTDVALLPIPTGTRNHFAHDVGIVDVDAAVRAAGQPARTAIDLGSVRGSGFVNNASVGVYSDLVRCREAREGRFPKRIANVLAAFEVLRRSRPMTVEVDGRSEAVWLVFVGNGSYGEKLFDLTSRESLGGGVLDVRIVRAACRFGRGRLLRRAVSGRFGPSKRVERRVASTLHLTVDAPGPVDLARDGEVEPHESPLDFAVVTGGLTVLVPPQS